MGGFTKVLTISWSLIFFIFNKLFFLNFIYLIHFSVQQLVINNLAVYFQIQQIIKSNYKNINFMNYSPYQKMEIQNYPTSLFANSFPEVEIVTVSKNEMNNSQKMSYHMYEDFECTPRKKLFLEELKNDQFITIKKNQWQLGKTQQMQILPEITGPLFNFWGMNHVRINRARMFDWFLEICKIFGQSWQTFWATRELLDRLIVQKGIIKVKNIHLYGSVCFFIASKYCEVNQIKLETLTTNILYNKFKKVDIIKCQEHILSLLLFSSREKSIHFQTVQDKLFQIYPDLQEFQAKQIMQELAFIYMDPLNAFQQIEIIEERSLIQQVAEKVLNEERFQNSQEVEMYYLENYGCVNLRRHSQNIKL